MECRNKYDIARAIAARDNISYDDAYELVEVCLVELGELLVSGVSAITGYNYAVDILQDTLGLEPDFLDILLEELV